MPTILSAGTIVNTLMLLTKNEDFTMPEIRPMSLTQLSEKLTDAKLKTLAAKTGLHYNTLRKIRDDPNANPTLNVMKALSEFFRKG